MKVNDSKVSGHLDSLFTRKEAVFTGFGCLTVEEYSGAFELFDMLDEQVVLDRLKGEG